MHMSLYHHAHYVQVQQLLLDTGALRTYLQQACDSITVYQRHVVLMIVVASYDDTPRVKEYGE